MPSPRARRRAPEGSHLSRLPGAIGPDRGHQLQRGGRPLRVPDRARLPARRHRRASSMRAAPCAPRAIRTWRRCSRCRLWEETNANERVAARLERERTAFYGVPVRRGIDLPEAIDAATDRANWLGVWQRLWSEGCGADGPAGDALPCSGFHAGAPVPPHRRARARRAQSRAWREDLQAPLARAWRERWSAGLAIPNPDIPNRDPLPFRRGTRAGRRRCSLMWERAVEALAPRPPLEIWESARPDTARRLVAGLAGFLSAAEVRALDHHLRRRAARAERAFTRRRARSRGARAGCASNARAPGRMAVNACAWRDAWSSPAAAARPGN